MSIPLPQLPALVESTVYVWVRHESGRYDPLPADLLALFRARDQEIVRCVLEAAANIAIANREPWTAKAIRALEFHHE